jgi:hypothetical protein
LFCWLRGNRCKHWCVRRKISWGQCWFIRYWSCGWFISDGSLCRILCRLLGRWSISDDRWSILCEKSILLRQTLTCQFNHTTTVAATQTHSLPIITHFLQTTSSNTTIFLSTIRLAQPHISITIALLLTPALHTLQHCTFRIRTIDILKVNHEIFGHTLGYRVISAAEVHFGNAGCVVLFVQEALAEERVAVGGTEACKAQIE